MVGPSAAIEPNNRDPYGVEFRSPAGSAGPNEAVGGLCGEWRQETGGSYLREHASTRPVTYAYGRPLPNVGVFSDGTNDGTSNYDALQVTLEKPFFLGLAFLNAYTWSHCFDIGSDARGIYIEYTPNPFLSYGTCDFNLPQLNVTSLLYHCLLAEAGNSRPQFQGRSINSSANVQFRMQPYNFFNRTNFGNPSSTITSATFGKIWSAYGPAPAHSISPADFPPWFPAGKNSRTSLTYCRAVRRSRLSSNPTHKTSGRKARRSLGH